MKRIFDLDKWDEILQSITRNKSRSFLTAFGIFWGIFMLVFLMGGGKGLKAMLASNFENLSQNSYMVFTQTTSKPYKGYKKGREWHIKLSDVASVKQKVSEVEHISPVLGRWGISAVYKDKISNGNTVKGIRPDFYHIESAQIVHGRNLNESDISQCRRVCVIGKKIQEDLFGDDNPIGQFIKVDSVYYQVVGINNSVSNMGVMGPTPRSIIIPYSTMQRLYNFGENVAMLAMTIKKGHAVNDIEPKVNAVLKQIHDIAPDDDRALIGFNTEMMFMLIESLFDGINLLVWLIGIGTLVAGAIGVSNIMMVTVSERTVEIGIRRAIGAKPRNILTQILSESILLTIIAGLFGISFATLLLSGLEHVANQSADTSVSFQVSFGMAAAAGVLLTLLGALAGIMPALRALSVRPIDAIRDE